MGQLLRTVCDKHEHVRDELVDTDIPTLRITIEGGTGKEMRRDIEGEFCKACVEELLEMLTPYIDAGRRPNTPPKPLPSRMGRKPGGANSEPVPSKSKADNEASPKQERRRPVLNPINFETPINPDTNEPYTDDFGKKIVNAGPYRCAAPGETDCIRHTIGFNTKQGRTSHERVGHGFNRNDSPKKPTIEDPSKEELEAFAHSA